MKKEIKILSTGVKVTHRQEGTIKVSNSADYDDRFDYPSIDTEMNNFYIEQLTNIFKPY